MVNVFMFSVVEQSGFFLYLLMLFHAASQNYKTSFVIGRSDTRISCIKTICPSGQIERKGKKSTLNRETRKIFNETLPLAILDLYLANPQLFYLVSHPRKSF